MRIAIIGLSPSTRHLVPWGDRNVEKWGLPWDEEGWPRMDRWFEMHDRNLLDEPEARRPSGYWDRIAFLSPVYMQRVWDDLPGSVAFPLSALQETVFADFPREDQEDLYDSSPAYMLALSIHLHMTQEPVEAVTLYGIDVKDGSEFALEQPCLAYLMGFAVGRGIKVQIPKGPSDLLRHKSEGIKLGTMSPIYPKRYGYL